MKKIFAIAMFVIVCAVSSRADFNAGFSAYQKGDFQSAFQELSPEANRGNSKAQFALGLLYQGGKGVDRDYIQAYMWYGLAEAKGHKIAPRNKGEVAKKMTPEEIEKAQALIAQFKPSTISASVVREVRKAAEPPQAPPGKGKRKEILYGKKITPLPGQTVVYQYRENGFVEVIRDPKAGEIILNYFDGGEDGRLFGSLIFWNTEPVVEIKTGNGIKEITTETLDGSGRIAQQSGATDNAFKNDYFSANVALVDIAKMTFEVPLHWPTRHQTAGSFLDGKNLHEYRKDRFVEIVHQPENNTITLYYSIKMPDGKRKPAFLFREFEPVLKINGTEIKTVAAGICSEATHASLGVKSIKGKVEILDIDNQKLFVVSF